MTGFLRGLSLNWQTRRPEITLEVDGDAEDIERLKDKKLAVELKQYRKKRSLDANALLWHCIGQISKSISADKWQIYLLMLKRYGKYSYVIVHESAVEPMKKQWRECEVVGEVSVNGKKAVQLLCYYGSSTYDSKEFSDLLDGVISEMKIMGLEPPTPGDIRRSLEEWEKYGKLYQDTNHTKPATKGE